MVSSFLFPFLLRRKERKEKDKEETIPSFARTPSNSCPILSNLWTLPATTNEKISEAVVAGVQSWREDMSAGLGPSACSQGENTRPARTWNRFSRNNRVTPSISDEASVVPGLSSGLLVATGVSVVTVGLFSWTFPLLDEKRPNNRYDNPFHLPPTHACLLSKRGWLALSESGRWS